MAALTRRYLRNFQRDQEDLRKDATDSKAENDTGPKLVPVSGIPIHSVTSLNLIDERTAKNRRAKSMRPQLPPSSLNAKTRKSIIDKFRRFEKADPPDRDDKLQTFLNGINMVGHPIDISSFCPDPTEESNTRRFGMEEFRRFSRLIASHLDEITIPCVSIEMEEPESESNLAPEPQVPEPSVPAVPEYLVVSPSQDREFSLYVLNFIHNYVHITYDFYSGYSIEGDLNSTVNLVINGIPTICARHPYIPSVVMSVEEVQAPFMGACW